MTLSRCIVGVLAGDVLAAELADFLNCISPYPPANVFPSAPVKSIFATASFSKLRFTTETNIPSRPCDIVAETESWLRFAPLGEIERWVSLDFRLNHRSALVRLEHVEDVVGGGGAEFFRRR